MKLTVFNGSPRGEDSNSNRIAQEFMTGAKEAGAEVENVFLAKRNIKHCQGCFKCWYKTPGKCVIRDDMEGLIQKFVSSDIVVFAMSLYVDNVTGIMKDFMDRLIPIIDPHFYKDENGECRHEKRYKKYPKLVVISNSGFPERSHFQVLELLFRRVARNLRTKVIAEIYLSPGYAITEAGPQTIANYKDLLRLAGREVVERSQLTEETVRALQRPLLPDEEYIRNTNENWDELLAKLKSSKS